ncbi:MAG: hypothetical protein GXO66_09620 [Euryarchaeota archaeon]|nr:hypothetical protein [Euryarchaeota archaeon]
MCIVRISPEAALMDEIEDYIKRKNRMAWSLYWSLTATVGMLIMLLPVNLVVNENGNLATWFILYIAFAGIALITYGAMLRGKMNMGNPIPVRRLPSGSPLGEVGNVSLPREDQELLYSLKELEEWFRDSSSNAARWRNPEAALKEIERWYRLGIIKEISIRNLRRRIRELEAELRQLRGGGDAPSPAPAQGTPRVAQMSESVRMGESVGREGIRVDA